MHSKRVYWAKKHNSDNGNNKRITLGIIAYYVNETLTTFLFLDVPESQKMHLVSLASVAKSPNKCQNNNNECSHLCLLSGKNTICACPIGMNLKEDNKTCFKPKECDSTQFHCISYDICIPRELRCNGKKDCLTGEDEEGCEDKRNKCEYGKYQCDNGECIQSSLVCDLHYDCKDKSDENDCLDHKKVKGCLDKHFQCNDGLCIAERYVCDGARDCFGGEDEMRCHSSTCSPDEFR